MDAARGQSTMQLAGQGTAAAGKREIQLGAAACKGGVKVLLALVIGNSHLQGQGVWVHLIQMYIQYKNCIQGSALLFPLLCMTMDGPSRTEPSQTRDMQHWMGVDVRACLAALSLTQGSDLLCPQPGEWV